MIFLHRIPHDSLKQALIQEAYRVRDNIVRSNGKGVWSDVPSARQSLTEDKLITYVEYLIDNVYVKVGNKVYTQCVGIPMGCSFTSTGTYKERYILG